jgi:pyruvate kinase
VCSIKALPYTHPTHTPLGAVPILTVVVPVLTTDNLTWQCSSEAPARQCLCSRGLVPILAEGSAR